MKKSVLFKKSPAEKHWVGDGFYVSSLVLPDPTVYAHYDPFILLDYAAPKEFPASSKQKGVGEHPHRGFETVTFAYQGEIAHRDSGGGGGIIKNGGVQWMTAARGVVHEELFSKEFTKTGGTLEMVQVWVNLPAKLKMSEPAYQEVEDKDFPRLNLHEAVTCRLIAGSLMNKSGPCRTHTPIMTCDLQWDGSAQIELDLAPGTNTICLVLNGSMLIAEQETRAGEIAVLSQEGKQVSLQASSGAKLLVLNGEPIQEPIVAHGPFVMNTKQEIVTAIEDFNSGKMGRLK